VRARPRLTSAPAESDGCVRAAVSLPVDEDEWVFAGHYPDFPIFPGVCVVDCAVSGALMTAPRPGLALSGIDSARFSGAVYPGDRLDIDLAWRPDGPEWTCTATATTGRGKAASVRLRFGVAA
jgi:3-hydroxyacyl-[acyl-carrier-protein] dehydratase